MSVEVVTSFTQDGFNAYGRRCVETFRRFWPKDAVLRVYAEECDEETRRWLLQMGAKVRDLHTACQDLVAFKTRHADSPGANGQFGHVYNYRFDALRFSNKVYAIAHAGEHTKADTLIWLDGDVSTFAPVTEDWIDGLMPPEAAVGYLGREKIGLYPECGFVLYRVGDMHVRALLRMMRQMYETDQVFLLPEWHDCMTFEVLRRGLELEQGLVCHDLSGEHSDQMHPFVNSRLGETMDHAKGPRKVIGRSMAGDLAVPRPEGYWQDAPVSYPGDAA